MGGWELTGGTTSGRKPQTFKVQTEFTVQDQEAGINFTFNPGDTIRRKGKGDSDPANYFPCYWHKAAGTERATVDLAPDNNFLNKTLFQMETYLGSNCKRLRTT